MSLNLLNINHISNQIDNMRIYDKVLTQEEITALYNE